MSKATPTNTTRGCSKVYSSELEYSADCVEWCPVERNAHLMLCGTYQLKESDENNGGEGDSSKNERIGKLYTFKLNRNSNYFNHANKDTKTNNNNNKNNNSNNKSNNSNNNNLVVLARECAMPGILDVKWSYKEIGGRVMYAVANAHGQLTLWAEGDDDGGGDDGDDDDDDGDGDNKDTDDKKDDGCNNNKINKNNKNKYSSINTINNNYDKSDNDDDTNTDDDDHRNDGNVEFTMINMITNEDGDDDSCLALSLDWDNAVDNSGDAQMAVSYSSGDVGVDVLGGGGLRQLKRWRAHDYEAWVCAFNYYNTNVLYTGGDDCRLRGWDLRSDCSHASFTSKQHEMGVCCMQQNPLHANILATGSYDERVIFWDQRSMRKALDEVKVGGGVWRVKWEPQGATEVVVAAMHGGFHVLDCASLCGKTSCSKQDVSAAIVASYHEHGSLAYGVDWFKGPITKAASDNRQRLLSSCSFYDRLLNLWTLDVSY